MTAASQEIAFTMQAGVPYRLAAIVADLYFATGAAASVTATAGDNSHLLAAGDSIELTARGTAVRVAVIRAGAVDGACTLSMLEAGSIS